MNIEEQFAKSMAHFVSVKEWEGYKRGVQDVCSVAQPLLDDMLEALNGLQQFFALDGECSVGRFDRLAEQYRRETGKWAPGKSIPDAYNDSTDCETRRKEYDAWVQSKVAAARAAIAKAKGDGQ